MRKVCLFLAAIFLLSGCEKKPTTDYASLNQSGMWSSNLDQLKKLNATDAEVAQLTKLKQAGASDSLCLALLKTSRDHHQEFSGADAAVSLSRAGYSDDQILEMAKSDQMELLSGEAVTLKLIGLSNATVQEIVRRRIQGLPTLTSAQISRLKNTGMSERQILEIVNQGMSEREAESYVARREAERNHSHTDFVRNRGRRR
jgi:hypothetical protein